MYVEGRRFQEYDVYRDCLRKHIRQWYLREAASGSALLRSKVMDRILDTSAIKMTHRSFPPLDPCGRGCSLER